MIPRPRHVQRLLRLLRQSPVVAIVGPRQIGKSTLARELIRARKGRAAIVDLEDPVDLADFDLRFPSRLIPAAAGDRRLPQGDPGVMRRAVR